MQHPLGVSDRNQPELSPQLTMASFVPRKEQISWLYGSVPFTSLQKSLLQDGKTGKPAADTAAT